jgi:hypothetical protein
MPIHDPQNWAGWAQASIERLMAPTVSLATLDRNWLVAIRARLVDRNGHGPMLNEKDRLFRMLRRYELEAKPPCRVKPAPLPPEEAQAAGWQHRPGAPPPRPPPLRRPTETWDPVGSPGAS